MPYDCEVRSRNLKSYKGYGISRWQCYDADVRSWGNMSYTAWNEDDPIHDEDTLAALKAWIDTHPKGTAESEWSPDSEKAADNPDVV